jgi:hypothetical protein
VVIFVIVFSVIVRRDGGQQIYLQALFSTGTAHFEEDDKQPLLPEGPASENAKIQMAPKIFE